MMLQLDEILHASFHISGGVVIIFVITIFILQFSTSFRRILAQREMFDRSLTLLDHRVEAALDHRQRRIQESLSWNGFRKFEVKKIEEENEDKSVCSFYLVPHDGKELPPFRPGQYLTFSAKIPGESKPVVRCYSLSDRPSPRFYRVSIKRVPSPPGQPDIPPGQVSGYFHDGVKAGDFLDVKAPSGNFYLDQTQETPVVLIGGGVGLTPVLSMVNSICGKAGQRETWFFYGVTNGMDHSMKEHLQRLDQKYDNLHLNVYYSKPRKSDKKGKDYHHQGWVSVAEFKRLLPSNNYYFYLCGPPPMMGAITADLAEWGVPSEGIHYEAFGAPSLTKVVDESTRANIAPAGHQVIFAKSGKSVKWDAGVESLLELGEANDVVLDYGCRAGSCGSCLVALKSGEVEYPHPPGYECEPRTVLTCCAIPKSDLEIDA